MASVFQTDHDKNLCNQAAATIGTDINSEAIYGFNGLAVLFMLLKYCLTRWGELAKIDGEDITTALQVCLNAIVFAGSQSHVQNPRICLYLPDGNELVRKTRFVGQPGDDTDEMKRLGSTMGAVGKAFHNSDKNAGRIPGRLPKNENLEVDPETVRAENLRRRRGTAARRTPAAAPAAARSAGRSAGRTLNRLRRRQRQARPRCATPRLWFDLLRRAALRLRSRRGRIHAAIAIGTDRHDARLPQ